MTAGEIFWDVVPYVVLAIVVGRHVVAVPLRQVRLDHPFVAALRVAAAADRQPDVPLRHPGRRSSVTSSGW